MRAIQSWHMVSPCTNPFQATDELPDITSEYSTMFRAKTASERHITITATTGTTAAVQNL